MTLVGIISESESATEPRWARGEEEWTSAFWFNADPNGEEGRRGVAMWSLESGLTGDLRHLGADDYAELAVIIAAETAA